MRAAERKTAVQTPQSGSGDATPLRAIQEIEAFAGDPNFMTSLARGLAVMRGFSQEQRRLSIAQLSQKTGIPRAAVRRVLYTLTRLGYVGSDDGRHYALQPRLLSLGHAYLSSTPLVTAAQPFLDRVSDAVDEVLLARLPRGRRHPLSRAIGHLADHLDHAQRRQPAAGVLHVDRPGVARRAARRRRSMGISRASASAASPTRRRPPCRRCAHCWPRCVKTAMRSR